MPPTHEQTQRRQEIASGLVRIEREKPGSILLRANPYLTRAALTVLEKLGFKKPLFASAEQFVIASFQSDFSACDALLGDCILVGPRDDRSGYPAWSGVGGFRGWLGALPAFQPTDPVLFAINIAPIFFSSISSDKALYELLESPKGDLAGLARAAANNDTLKRSLELLRDLPPK